jgi:hypothetical protein
MKTTSQLCGLLIFLSFIATLYAYFFNPSLLVMASILAWIAFIMLFKQIVHKTLLYVLILLTFICFCINYFNDFEMDIQKTLSINAYLLCLLIGVGFLRLIATPKEEKIKALPQGKQSFIKTYLGIHLFGSVINLSSLLLVGDKMVKYAPLSKLQIIVLTRAFSSDAYWSPFFVAFAAALTYAPKLNTLTIFSFGLVLALFAFIVTYLEIKNSDDFNINEFKGYPIHFETLYLPFVLALMVLLTHAYYPNIKIIVLISLFSLFLCILILPFKEKNPIKLFSNHILIELPKMKNELALFLIAGAFGVMLSSILEGLHIQLPFETLNGLSASVLLFILIILSFIGIHPIISIAIIGNWMNELNHTLLAVTFLMSWATAVSTSPFSGLNLTMQSRYNLKAIDLFKVNIFYAFKMYGICVVLLFVLAYYLGD